MKKAIHAEAKELTKVINTYQVDGWLLHSATPSTWKTRINHTPDRFGCTTENKEVTSYMLLFKLEK